MMIMIIRAWRYQRTARAWRYGHRGAAVWSCVSRTPCARQRPYARSTAILTRPIAPCTGSRSSPTVRCRRTWWRWSRCARTCARSRCASSPSTDRRSIRLISWLIWRLVPVSAAALGTVRSYRSAITMPITNCVVCSTIWLVTSSDSRHTAL